METADFVRNHLADDNDLRQAYGLLVRLPEAGDDNTRWMQLNRAQTYIKKAYDTPPNRRAPRRDLDPAVLNELEAKGMEFRVATAVSNLSKGAKSDSRHDRKSYLSNAVRLLQMVKEDV